MYIYIYICRFNWTTIILYLSRSRSKPLQNYFSRSKSKLVKIYFLYMRSHAALAGRGMFISKNSHLIIGHFATIMLYVNRFSRFSSSWLFALFNYEVMIFIRMAWCLVIWFADYIAVRRGLMNLTLFLDKNRNTG